MSRASLFAMFFIHINIYILSIEESKYQAFLYDISLACKMLNELMSQTSVVDVAIKSYILLQSDIISVHV